MLLLEKSAAGGFREWMVLWFLTNDFLRDRSSVKTLTVRRSDTLRPRIRWYSDTRVRHLNGSWFGSHQLQKNVPPRHALGGGEKEDRSEEKETLSYVETKKKRSSLPRSNYHHRRVFRW